MMQIHGLSTVFGVLVDQRIAPPNILIWLQNTYSNVTDLSHVFKQQMTKAQSLKLI